MRRRKEVGEEVRDRRGEKGRGWKRMGGVEGGGGRGGEEGRGTEWEGRRVGAGEEGG